MNRIYWRKTHFKKDTPYDNISETSLIAQRVEYYTKYLCAYLRLILLLWEELQCTCEVIHDLGMLCHHDAEQVAGPAVLLYMCDIIYKGCQFEQHLSVAQELVHSLAVPVTHLTQCP